MKWLDDAPESWDEAPEHPPAEEPEAEVASDVTPNGLVVREPNQCGAFIFARDEEITVEEYA